MERCKVPSGVEGGQPQAKLLGFCTFWMPVRFESNYDGIHIKLCTADIALHSYFTQISARQNAKMYVVNGLLGLMSPLPHKSAHIGSVCLHYTVANTEYHEKHPNSNKRRRK